MADPFTTLPIPVRDGFISANQLGWNKVLSTMLIKVAYEFVNQQPPVMLR
jgi:hypothetical protein